MTRKRLVLLVFSLLLLVLGIPFLLMKKQESDALAWARVGRGALNCFKEVSKALGEKDIAMALESFDQELIPTLIEPLIFKDVQTMDGVTLLQWHQGGEKKPLEEILGDLIKPYSALSSVKLKVSSIEETSEDFAEVKALLWMRGVWEDGRSAQTHLHLRLGLVESNTVWRIAKFGFEKGRTTLGHRTYFESVAGARGLDFISHRNPLYETAEWDPKRFGIFKYSSAGVSATDYNNDDLEDLFFADGASFALYRNNDGSFEDVTKEVGLPLNAPGYNVGLFADLNNDGHQDLFLGGLTNRSMIFKNNGNGTFTEVDLNGLIDDPLVTVAAAADYDLDGDLDLYFGRYLDPRKDLPVTLFYTRNSGGNTLLRNDGDFKFVDVTQEAGVREGGLTLGVAWSDYDEDGDPDLYVANDFGRNALLRNEGDGTFSDVTKESGTLDFGFGMSASFGDVNADGKPDLYVSNVRSSQRWYGQTATLYKYLNNSVKQGTFLEDWPVYREIVSLAGDDWRNYGDFMVKGSSLFLNQSNGRFAEVSESSDANPLGWYWSSNFLDYNNDGLLDVYAVNGWITGHEKDDL